MPCLLHSVVIAAAVASRPHAQTPAAPPHTQTSAAVMLPRVCARSIEPGVEVEVTVNDA